MVKIDPKNGKWRFDIYEKKTRKHICKTGFKTKTEAKKAEDDAKNLGEYAIQGNKKLYQVIEEKLDEIKVCNAESTYDTFTSLYEHHIKGILIDKPIKNYTRNEISEFFKTLDVDSDCPSVLPFP